MHEVRRSASLEPGYVMSWAGVELLSHGHADAARRVFDRAIEWYRSRPTAEAATRLSRQRLGWALTYVERWDEAAAIAASLAAEAPGSTDYLGLLGVSAAGQGDSAAARHVSERLRAMDDPYLNGRNTYQRAAIAAQLGEREEAVRLLREALGQGYSIYQWAHMEPAFGALRDYPPFQELLRPRG